MNIQANRYPSGVECAARNLLCQQLLDCTLVNIQYPGKKTLIKHLIPILAHSDVNNRKVKRWGKFKRPVHTLVSNTITMRSRFDSIVPCTVQNLISIQ